LAVADLLLVIEIVSAGSDAMDELTKHREYALAGIPREDAAGMAAAHGSGRPYRLTMAWGSV
jgi:hypothetical protein